MRRTRRVVWALPILLLAGTCLAQQPQQPASQASAWQVESVKCTPARFCGSNSNNNSSFRRFAAISEVVVLHSGSSLGTPTYLVREPAQRETAARWKPGDSAGITAPDAEHRCPAGNDAVLRNDTAREWVCAAYQSGGAGKIAKIDSAYDKYMSREEVDIQLGDLEPPHAYTFYVVQEPAAVKQIAASWRVGDAIATLASDSSHPCADLASEVLINARTNQWVCTFLQKR